MDYKILIKALTCSNAEDEPDNLGCKNRKCKYRDTDGACNVVSMCEDAAIAIEKLIADLDAEKMRVDKAEKEKNEAIKNVKSTIGCCVFCKWFHAGFVCPRAKSNRDCFEWKGIKEE